MRGGIILAGGRSTRFGGQEKALAMLDGRPLIGHVASALTGVVDRIVINCRAEQRADLEPAMSEISDDVSWAIDPTPDQGPLAGIGHACKQLNDPDYTAVVACDMPFLETELLELLFDRAHGRDGVVPRIDARNQPTHAVYRVGAMRRASEKALEDDRKWIAAAFEWLDLAELDETTVQNLGALRSFENINTQREWVTAAARIVLESDAGSDDKNEIA